MFIFDAAPAGGMYAPKADEAAQKLSENIFKLSCSLRELVVGYNREAIKQLETPHPANAPIRVGVDIGSIQLQQEQIIDIASKSLNMPKDSFQVVGTQIMLSAPPHSSLIATDASNPITLPSGSQPDLTQEVKSIKKESIKTPDDVNAELTSFMTHLGSKVVGMNLTADEAKEYVLGAMELAKSYIQGSTAEKFELVVDGSGHIQPAGLTPQPLEASQQPVSSAPEQIGAQQTEVVPASTIYQQNQTVQITPVENAPISQVQQMLEDELKAWVTLPDGQRTQIPLEDYDKGKFSLVDNAGMVHSFVIDNTYASEGGSAPIVTEVKPKKEKKDDLFEIKGDLVPAAELEIRSATMAIYFKLEALAAKSGKTEKDPIKKVLEQADVTLDAAKLLPEGKRADKFKAIGEKLQKDYDNIIQMMKNPVIASVTPPTGKQQETPIGPRKVRVKEDIEAITVNGQDYKGAGWQQSLNPTVNPAVSYGDMEVGVEKHVVKLQVVVGDARYFDIIYPEFEKDGRTPKKKEKGLVVPKSSRNDGNYVYEPGAFYNNHQDYAVVTSGTYSVMGTEGISYPMGGIKSNGVELSPSRQNVFDNKNDPRYEIFYSRHSPATMGWVTTLYVDENGKPSMKSSLEVSDAERMRWPTWIEAGKMLVANGKSTWDEGAAEGVSDTRMALVIIDGKIGMIVTKKECTRKEFALALSKIPGLTFASQIDGSSASQMAIRDPEGSVKDVTGRGTINLFGFRTSQTMTASEKK